MKEPDQTLELIGDDSPNDSDRIWAEVQAYRTELKSDKKDLQKECKALRKENKELENRILRLSNEILAENITLRVQVKFLRTTQWFRELGAGVLAICGVTAPLFNFNVIYWCLVTFAIASFVWGVILSRQKFNT